MVCLSDREGMRVREKVRVAYMSEWEREGWVNPT